MTTRMSVPQATRNQRSPLALGQTLNKGSLVVTIDTEAINLSDGVRPGARREQNPNESPVAMADQNATGLLAIAIGVLLEYRRDLGAGGGGEANVDGARRARRATQRP
jgi:hypothetical protein